MNGWSILKTRDQLTVRWSVAHFVFLALRFLSLKQCNLIDDAHLTELDQQLSGLTIIDYYGEVVGGTGDESSFGFYDMSKGGYCEWYHDEMCDDHETVVGGGLGTECAPHRLILYCPYSLSL